MGFTSYDSQRSVLRSKSYASKSREVIFSSRGIHEDMNPSGLLFRESRDSDIHPNSFPVIIALDETGSMGHIPESLVKGGLTKIMSGIVENGIPDPQILFIGVGDHKTDNAPLQVGQFESGDDLLDKWLTNVYLEGCGGGNGGESYFLPWYIAAKYVRTDHWEKRNQKGILVTIGDENVHNMFTVGDQKRIMGGDGDYTDLSAQEILAEASKKWEIYHIHTTQTYNGAKKEVQDKWRELLGENLIIADDYEKIPSIIARLVAEYSSKTVEKVEKKQEDKITPNSSVIGEFDPFK